MSRVGARGNRFDCGEISPQSRNFTPNVVDEFEVKLDLCLTLTYVI